MKRDLRAFETIIGYTFKNKTLLETMLTHPSLTKKGRVHGFERLEFLGDRVLGLVIADWLYRAQPGDDEGLLSKRHSHFVGRDMLQRVAEHLQIKHFLCFDQDVRQRHHTIFSDACEALIGAVYLDGGFKAAQKFILKAWKTFLREPTVSFVDPKSALQEWSQFHQKGLPVYEVVEMSGPDHNRTFKVCVYLEGIKRFYGTGPSKRSAEKQAAENLLSSLKSKQTTVFK